MADNNLNIVIRAMLDQSQINDPKDIQAKLNDLAGKLKLSIQIDPNSLNTITHSFSALGSEVEKTQTKIKKFYVDSQLSGEGFKDLKSRVQDIKNSADEFAKVTINTYKNTGNLKSAVIEYRNEMGQLVKEQLAWTEFFDKKNNTTKKGFQTTGFTFVDDIAKQQSQLDKLQGTINKIDESIYKLQTGGKGVINQDFISDTTKKYQELIDIVKKAQQENRMLSDDEDAYYRKKVIDIDNLIREQKKLDSKSSFGVGIISSQDVDLFKSSMNRQIQSTSSQYGRLVDTSSIQKLREELEKIDAATPNVNMKMKQLREELRQIATDAGSKAHTTLNTIFHDMEKMATWEISGGLYFGVQAGLDKLMENAKDISASFTKLKQVLELSDQIKGVNQLNNSLGQLQKVAGQQAVLYGQDMATVLDVMAQAGRRFKDVPSIIVATDNALQAMVADNVDSMTAIKGEEAMMAQFGLSLGETRDAWSKLTVASHVFLTDTTGIIDAVERSGSAFHGMKMNSDTAIASIVALAQESGRTGSVIGNTFKSLITSFETSKGVKALHQLGIEAHDSNGKLLDGLTVLSKLQEKWPQLSEASRQAFANILSGGKYQINQLLTFLNDTSGTYVKALDAMKKATQEVQQELVKSALESLPNQIKMTSAQIQVMANSFSNMALPAMISFFASIRSGSKYISDHAQTIETLVKTGLKLIEAYGLWRVGAILYTTSTESAIAQTALMKLSLLKLEAQSGGTVGALSAISGAMGTVAATAATVAARIGALALAVGVFNSVVERESDPLNAKEKDLKSQLDVLQKEKNSSSIGDEISSAVQPVKNFFNPSSDTFLDPVRAYSQTHELVTNPQSSIDSEIENIRHRLSDIEAEKKQKQQQDMTDYQKMINDELAKANQIHLPNPQLGNGKENIDPTEKNAKSNKKALDDLATAYKNEEDHLQKLYELKMKNNQADIDNTQYLMSQVKKGSEDHIKLIQQEIDLKQKRIKLLEEEKKREEDVAKNSPSTTDTTTSASISGNTTASKISSFFAQKGLSSGAISGILGNLQQESSLDPNAEGGGLAQWQGSRWNALVSYAKQAGLSVNSLEAQLGYLWKEISSGSQGVSVSKLNSLSASDAAKYFSNNFERPGIPMMDKRVSYANDFSKSMNTYVKVADEAANKSADFSDQIAKLKQEIATLSAEKVTDTLTGFDDKIKEVETDMNINKYVADQYNQTSQEYRDIIAKQIPLLAQKEEYAHQEADFIRSQLSQLPKNSQQYADLNDKLKSITQTYWDAFDAVKSTNEEIAKSKLAEIVNSTNDIISPANDVIDELKAKMDLLGKTDYVGRDSLINVIGKQYEDQIPVFQNSIAKIEDLNKSLDHNSQQWKDNEKQIRDYEKQMLSTAKSVQDMRNTLNGDLASILQEQSQEFQDNFKKQHDTQIQNMENNLKSVTDSYDQQNKLLQDKLTLLDQEYNKEDRIKKLNDINTQLNQAKADTSHEYIDASGKVELTYDKAKVADLKKQQDDLIQQYNREDVKQSIQNSIDQLKDAKDQQVKLLQGQIDQTKQQYQQEEDNNKLHWDSLIKSATQGTLKFDDLFNGKDGWYSKTISQLQQFGINSTSQIEQIKSIFQSLGNLQLNIPQIGTIATATAGGGGSSNSTLDMLGQKYNEAMAKGDTASASFYHQAANDYRQQNGMQTYYDSNTDKSSSNHSSSSTSVPSWSSSQVQAARQAAIDAGGVTASSGKIPGFAVGGRVEKKTLAWVGEDEPETIIPDSFFKNQDGFTVGLNKIDTSKLNLSNILKAVDLVKSLTSNIKLPDFSSIMSKIQPQTVDQSKHYSISNVTVQANDAMSFLDSINFLIRSQTT